MSSGSPSQTVQLVGGPTRGSPSNWWTGRPSELALEIVQRGVERGARGELPLGQARHDLLERERVVAEQPGMLLDVRLRRLRRLVVALDRRRLAEAVHAAVPDLHLDDALLVLARCAR